MLKKLSFLKKIPKYIQEVILTKTQSVLKNNFSNIGYKNRRQFIKLLGLSTALVTFGSIGRKALAQLYPNQYHYLRHLFSGKYVCSGDTENGGAIWLWSPIPFGHESRYKFYIMPTGDGYYYLRHQFSGRYVCSGETQNGGAIWLWGPIPPGHEPRYKFSLIPTADGYYYLIHLFSGKYVCSGDTENGGKLWLWGPIPEGHEVRYKFQLQTVPG